MANCGKFIEERITAKGEDRGFVDFTGWKNLWFNTGTLCNLECTNCYIESSPKNDRLAYITANDVKPFLNEIMESKLLINRIGFTGGEPFLNPHMLEILEAVLESGLTALVLTNAYRVIKRIDDKLLDLNNRFPNKLQLRVSLDHHTPNRHNEERGDKTFEGTMESLKWLWDSGFHISIAGRSLTEETQSDALAGYQNALRKHNVDLDLSIGDRIVIFPEMDNNREVPEITTACWGILNKRPEDQMCASERMIVKRKSENHCRVQACTLLAYQDEFDMGRTLREAQKRVYLNHPYCAMFCVLGGASCSSTN